MKPTVAPSKVDVRVAVLTVSDSASRGVRPDLSGPAVARRVRKLGWRVVFRKVVPDSFPAIRRTLLAWSKSRRVDIILTAGGTGLGLRDVTPEATESVLGRLIPGLAELMRRTGQRHSKFAPLSRALAGTRGACLIVNLPGSPAGAVQSLAAIARLLPHVVLLLRGQDPHSHR